MIWQLANKNPELNPGDVHIWRAHLPSHANALHQYYEILSKEEANRAERFKFADHQERFIIAKGMLRSILSRYLNLPPQAIIFSYGQHGKPSIDISHTSGQTLQFNQSDSQDFAVYGITMRREIGIDIEYMQRAGISRDDIARRYFSSTEYDSLMHLPESRREAAFYRLWTCKEAFLKAIGLGLSFPLQNFDINITLPDPQLLRISDAALSGESWQIRTLAVAENYASAFAVKEAIRAILLWDYEPFSP
jgi:4'-phosphopantetheinyl transferase